MFLYYFDNEFADAPRGVIDLELYNNVVHENRAIKLSTNDENYHLRSFYFDDDDKENLNEWITSFIRDRYHAVVDERNAYQQMQSEMTGAIDHVSTLKKMSEKERENLEKELHHAKLYANECKAVLQNMLVIMGITDDDMSRLTEIQKIGQKTKLSLAELKAGYEKRLEELMEVIILEMIRLASEIIIITYLGNWRAKDCP